MVNTQFVSAIIYIVVVSADDDGRTTAVLTAP
jgi:hypothetical protein